VDEYGTVVGMRIDRVNVVLGENLSPSAILLTMKLT
jgi:hypothetical protein